ncbi:MAG TPA: c-type cytochrome [Gemmatimonadales bacterium]|nr:c-type cytochrome [Gemmatimonadales bacterium]
MRSLALLVAGLIALAAPARGQRFPPDSLTNLKYYPRAIPVRALIDSMRAFTAALGVRCSYCHVGEEGQPLSTYDFAKDDKRAKLVARVMLDMVAHINTEHLADVPERSKPPVVVRCETCHHGLAKPERLQDALARVLADSGVDAAVRRYGALRERYYGSGAYDFSENTLNEMGRQLIRSAKPDDAIALLRLNTEQFPDAGMPVFLIGEAQAAQGDTAAAIASIRAAMAKDSTLARQGTQRLQALGAR